MLRARAQFIAFTIFALVTGGSPAVWALDPTPEHRVEPGVEQSVPVPGADGSIVFLDNDQRKRTIRVDVSTKAPDEVGPAARSEAGQIVGDIVQVTAEDLQGQPVTALPNKVSQEKSPKAPAVAEVIPGFAASLPVDSASVRGVDPNAIRLVTRTGAKEAWSQMPSAYDPSTGKVTGYGDRLGEFAVMVETPKAPGDSGPTVVLDPDDQVGFANWGAKPKELEQNLKLTSAVSARLQQTCQADVVLTRGEEEHVPTSVRAQIAKNADPDLMVTLAFNANRSAEGDRDGSPWGTEDDGGVRAWATSPSDVAFAQRFLDAVPEYTGRPSTQRVQASDGTIPYPELDAVDATYAHVEMLFLDHRFDQPVITEKFDLVVDAAVAAMVGQLRAQGFNCATGGLPQRPSSQELTTLRNLGWQNYQLYGADPVSFSSGNYLMNEPVFALSGVGDQEIDLNLTYNSQDNREGVFGIGWSFAYNVAYQQLANGDALVRFDDGRTMLFEKGAGGTFRSPPAAHATLTRPNKTTAQLKTSDNELFRFTVDAITGYGVLAGTTDRQGNSITLSWGAPTGSKQLRPLAAIVDEAGQRVKLKATPDGRIASITHPDGRVWCFTYTADRLATLTDPRGTKRRFQYSPAGYMTKVTAGDGVTYVDNSYDSKGRVTAQRNATGDVRRFAYHDKRTVYTDAIGNKTTYVFDDKGQVTQTINAHGKKATTDFDSAYNPIVKTDEGGRVTRTHYDNHGRPLKVTDPLGQVTTMRYNKSGDLISMEQPDGLGGLRTTTYEVNSAGRVVKTTFDDRTTMRATFDKHGDRTSSTDQNGHTTRFVLDGRGNTVRTINPLKGETSATFDRANRQLTLKDENRHVTRYTYDAADNLLCVTDPLGNKTRYTYDVNNKRTSETDALGRTTKYTYDKNLNLIGIKHPDGSREAFTLDREYNVTKARDGRGSEVKTTFDALLRPIVTVDENGQQWTTEYDAVGNPVKATDPAGKSVTMAYDKLDRVVRSVDRNGGTWRTEYDAAGNRVKDTAPDGTAIRAEFDALGQMVAAIDEQGHRTTVSYDKAGNVSTRTDRRGNTTSSGYDALDRLISVKNPDNGVERRTYDPAGNLTSVTDPLGGTVRTGYDAADRAVKNTDELGAVSTTKYDAVGNPITKVDAAGNAWRMQYDAMNRLSAKISPLGDREGYKYDPNGNLVSLTKPDGVVQRRDYDGRDALVKVIENAKKGAKAAADVNVTTRYQRNAAGWHIATVDAKGARTSYVVDGLGQPVKRTDPLGRVTTWTYRSVGTLATKTDANGKKTTYRYDPDRQLAEEAFADGTRTTYAYDADNNLTSMTDTIGTSRWSRDWRGQETSSTDAAGRTVRSKYDLNGKRTQIVYPSGLNSARTYDKAKRLASVSDPSGVIEYARDVLGRTTSVAHPNGASTELGYDDEGNITSISRGSQRKGHHKSDNRARHTGKYGATQGLGPSGDKQPKPPSGLTIEYSYTPDNLVATREVTASGSKSGKSHPNAETHRRRSKPHPGQGTESTTYSYDGLNRLLRSEGNDSNAEYSYDAVGNRIHYRASQDPVEPAANRPLSLAYSYDKADQLLTEQRRSGEQQTTTTRSYDRNGNLLRKATQPSDAEGTAGDAPETVNYAYNLRDEMVSAPGTTWKRDGLGRALTRTSGGEESEFVFDQFKVIEAIGKETGTYVRDDASQLLSQTRSEQTEMVLNDVLGTVWGTSTAADEFTPSSRYTDFGELIGSTEPVSPFGFAGELQDPATSRIDFHARAYDPQTGRFLQRDRMGQDPEKPTSLHPYMYAFNAPTTYTDYLGNFGWSDVRNFVSEHKGAIIGTAAGIAVGAVIIATAPASLPTLAVIGAASVGGSVAGGMTQRAIDGQPVADPKAVAFDVVLGAATAGLGGVASQGVKKAAPLVKNAVQPLARGLRRGGKMPSGGTVAKQVKPAAVTGKSPAVLKAANAKAAVDSAKSLGKAARPTTKNRSSDLADLSRRKSSGVQAGRAGTRAESSQIRGATQVDGVKARSNRMRANGQDTTRLGSGSGPWAEGVGARSGGAIGQLTPGSCVSACGAMLSGRSQAELLEILGDWSNVDALARELGEGWIGGLFGSAEDAIEMASRGRMGARLQAAGKPGHMVVTTPLDDGRFLVQDPWDGGSTYEVGSDWIAEYVSGGVFQ